MLEMLIQQIVNYLQTPQGKSHAAYLAQKAVQSAEEKLRQKREDEERRKRRDRGESGQ